MSNNTANKGYQIGDYIDTEVHSPEVKLIHQITTQGLQLKDPFTGQIDVHLV